MTEKETIIKILDRLKIEYFDDNVEGYVIDVETFNLMIEYDNKNGNVTHIGQYW